MEFRQSAKYDLASVSSLGVRLTPLDRQPVHTSDLFHLQATSAETNVLSISAALGLNTLVLTKFVSQSPIASFIQRDLRKRNIAFEAKEVDSGGPWGFRHQFNIADSGFGPRGPIVSNDRAGEVGRTISADDFDLDRIFHSEGVRLLHLSGLIAALSDSTAEACIDIAKIARQNGTRISFDLNYRVSFWQGRESQLRSAFHEIASLSDVIIGNEEDFQLSLGIKGPQAGGEGIQENLSQFENLVTQAKLEYPGTVLFATTLREVVDANNHLWGAIILTDSGLILEEPRTISVLDRIGGGDGFVGGLLYGLLKGWEPKESLKFAWASGALAATMLTDYATPIDENQVWKIYDGNARVQR